MIHSVRQIFIKKFKNPVSFSSSDFSDESLVPHDWMRWLCPMWLLRCLGLCRAHPAANCLWGLTDRSPRRSKSKAIIKKQNGSIQGICDFICHYPFKYFDYWWKECNQLAGTGVQLWSFSWKRGPFVLYIRVVSALHLWRVDRWIDIQIQAHIRKHTLQPLSPCWKEHTSSSKLMSSGLCLFDVQYLRNIWGRTGC